MVRVLAVLVAAVLAVPTAAAAQGQKSADLAKQLAQLLDEKKLTAIAAPTETPDAFVAALYISGTQLLAVSAKYSAPQLLNEKLAKKDYQDIYVDLSSASVVGSKVLVMDIYADGLVAKPKGDNPADSVDRGNVTTAFDGDYKKAKLSESDYVKAFDECEAAYVKILQTLITKLKST